MQYFCKTKFLSLLINMLNLTTAKKSYNSTNPVNVPWFQFICYQTRDITLIYLSVGNIINATQLCYPINITILELDRARKFIGRVKIGY